MTVENLNPQPSTFNPQLFPVDSQPSTFNPQLFPVDSQPSTLNPQPSMQPFQIVFTPMAAAELARMPRELQLQILGEFRGLPHQVLGAELAEFGQLEQGGRTLH